MKLWDVRMMVTMSQFTEIEALGISSSGYDYRMQSCPPMAPHPRDVSVSTFRGHKVLKTLIRCHFAPENCTGQKYVEY